MPCSGCLKIRMPIYSTSRRFRGTMTWRGHCSGERSISLGEQGRQVSGTVFSSRLPRLGQKIYGAWASSSREKRIILCWSSSRIVTCIESPTMLPAGRTVLAMANHHSGAYRGSKTAIENEKANAAIIGQTRWSNGGSSSPGLGPSTSSQVFHGRTLTARRSQVA